MAVRIDVQAFRDSIPPAVGAAAARLLDGGAVGELEPIGGGAQAVVREGDVAFQPWVGVIDRAFTGECECGPAGEGLCPHAVALALTAFDAGVVFAAAGSPPSTIPLEGERAEYLRAVRRLAPRQLADLVVEHATRDRLFATLLLGGAGLIDGADGSGLADFRAVIRDVSNTTGDVQAAGDRLAAEAEILCARPATAAMLDLIEKAVEVWDDLAVELIEDPRADPEEVTDLLLDAHRDLCERLDLDPDEIARRVTRLAGRCENIEVDAVEWAVVRREVWSAIG